MANELLKVENLSVSYGLIKAVRNVSFHVNEGEIVTVLGANGAGKTTIMHAISGLIPKAGGEIYFDGKKVTNIPGHKLVPLGIAQVPERRRVFKDLTVLENIKMGGYTNGDKSGKKEILEKVYDYFPVLAERKKQLAGTLSGGEQQMLAISRALMSNPKLLLLDEPSMGLSPLYVKTVFEIIERINKAGTTILLVEQNAHMALEIADRAYVLEVGNITLDGDAKELMNDENVKKAYLGG